MIKCRKKEGRGVIHLMKKIVLTILLFLLLLPLTEIQSQAAMFKDVGTTYRAAKEINYLAEGKIVNGDLSGRFNVDGIVTRAEAAAMVGRALNVDGNKRNTQFKDVGSQNFASGYIQSMANQNILSGYSDGTFRPNANVTRGEMAILISKAFGFEYGGTRSGAANALLQRGIAQGLKDGTFGFDQQIKRADFAVFLARTINYKLRLNPSVDFKFSATVTASSLNVRSGPSTNYARTGTLQQGAKIEVAYNVGPWLYFRSGSLEGFVHQDYVSGSNLPAPPKDESPIAQQVIVIDPGHGGKDSGAVGFGLREKDVVLDTSLKLKTLLAKTPFQVKLTRETDVFLELSDRVAFAKRANADIFVSIHANAFTSESANGTETYYYAAAQNTRSEDSKLLATKIQSRMLDAWKLNNRGVKHGNFHVLRENTMPAALVELGFITNKSDNEKLASATWRQRAAEAIYLGILDYYKEKGYNVNSYYNF